MSLRGDLRTLEALKRALRKMPITASAKIATRSAPVISNLAQGAYDSGTTVYGGARPLGVDGKRLDLVRTGDSKRAMNFIATGRDIRTARLPGYTRYLIGKYDVLPNGPLPAEWRERMTAIAADVMLAEIRAVSEQ